MDKIETLEDLRQQHQERLRHTPPSPLSPKMKRIPMLTLGELLEKDRMRTIETRTGLTRDEFNTVLKLLHPLGETIKRGPKPLPLDIRLVILLQWLSFGQTYEQLGLSIGLSGKTIQSAIASIWNLVDEAISMFIPKSPFKYTPTRKFSSFPEAIGAVDATLLPVAKPLDKIKNKLYYSGKHCRHGVKLQVCCAPDGMCIHFGGICPGSQHDFKLFKESGLVKALTTHATRNSGGSVTRPPQLLADGGYLGICNKYLEARIPFRRHARTLSKEQADFNKKLGRDRVIVENYFGRMKKYWGILACPYRCELNSMEVLARMCVSLTNLKLIASPLRSLENCHDPMLLDDGDTSCPQDYTESDSPSNNGDIE